MADPVTSNILLAVPTHGSDVDTWDQPINSDFLSLDGFLAGVQTISVASSNLTLTAPSGSVSPSGGPTQAQNSVLRFTGTLTSNVQVTLPLPGRVVIENLTVGNFVLSFRAVSSGQVIGIQQGACQNVYNDGTNVRFVDLGKIGEYWFYGGSSVPDWVNACTVPPYLNCDGTSFTGSTYPSLNRIIGNTTLPDLRGRGWFALNQGTNRITTAGSGLNGDFLQAVGGDQSIQSHQHAYSGTTQGMNANNPHNHGLNNYTQLTYFGGSQQPGQIMYAPAPSTTAPTDINHGHAYSGTTNLAGAGVSQNMPPAAIGGIVMIRAA